MIIYEIYIIIKDNYIFRKISKEATARWCICVRCFNLQASGSKEAHSAMRWIGSGDRAVSQLTNTKAVPAGALGNGNGFRCPSLLYPERFYPLRFDFCLALRACEIQFARRKLTCARAPSQRIQSGFSQFSKFKEMIPPILSPASETALPSPHLFHVPSRARTNLRLSPARARWSNFQGKLKNCHGQIGNYARAPKLVSPAKAPLGIEHFPEVI